ncbi:MAG: ABC transporter permease [Coriobacteriia bacterium]|nr:ABC transporter permease [Coriobacteriia bacterium]
MIRALQAEFSKLKRSRMILWTALVIIGYTSIGLATYPVLEDLVLDMEAQVAAGDTSAQDNVFVDAGIIEINWETAMRFIPMGVSGAWGMMLLSLVTAYVFGRELREGTDIASATLPVRREAFVVAKMVVVAVWAIGLGLLAVIAQVGVDAIYLGFEGFKWVYVWRAFVDTLYAMLPLYLTLPLVAWLSLRRKGYLWPMLFALATFTVASSLIGTDFAAYVPWSMPIVLFGVTWMPLRGELTAVSWVIAFAVFAVGMLLVLRRVNRTAEAA